MGFDLTGAFCVPVKDPVLNVTLWHIDGVLECGHINRTVQSVIDGRSSADMRWQEPGDVAGTALISLLFKRFLKLQKEAPEMVKAPAFYFKRGVVTRKNVRYFQHRLFSPTHQWEELPPGSHRIVPQEGTFGRWPGILIQFDHNQSLDRVSDLISTEPIHWVPCGIVASWFDEFWLESTTSGLKLEENWRAKARLESWHAQLRVYAEYGANLLVVSLTYRNM